MHTCTCRALTHTRSGAEAVKEHRTICPSPAPLVPSTSARSCVSGSVPPLCLCSSKRVPEGEEPNSRRGKIQINLLLQWSACCFPPAAVQDLHVMLFLKLLEYHILNEFSLVFFIFITNKNIIESIYIQRFCTLIWDWDVSTNRVSFYYS